MLIDISYIEVFYSILIVLVTIVVVLLIKIFGNIPASTIGTDLNILTYGFLWDTVIKSVRGKEYWINFEPSLVFELNKATILLVICLVNTILMAWNFKICHKASIDHSLKTRLILKPISLVIGMISLFFFLFCRVVWG